MFGGLAFLLQGNMSVSASRAGPVSTHRSGRHRIIPRPAARDMMQMGGRTMDGWITIAPEGLPTKRELAAWVKRGVAFAKTLPAK